MPPTSPLARRPLLVGVVHLPPLPGAPGGAATPGRRLPKWVSRARTDAAILAEAGFDAVIVENFGDAPFHKEQVPAETTAALAIAARDVRETLPARVARAAAFLSHARAASSA